MCLKYVFCSLLYMGLISSHINAQNKSDKGDFTKQHIQFEFVLHDGITLSQVSFVKKKLEQSAVRILKDLKVNTNDSFTVYVWGDYNHYLEAQSELGMTFPGSTGYVMGPNSLALFFTENVEENAEHEFAHAISLKINPNFGNNPRWFWESVAIYEAKEFKHPKEIDYLVQGDFPSLKVLNGNFEEGQLKIYELGYLLGEFIVEKWGRDVYIELIIASGNIKKVLGISDTEFEQQWKSFVQKKYFN